MGSMTPRPATARLIVSVSGLRESTLEGAVDLVGELERRSVPVSLLVAPRRGREYRMTGQGHAGLATPPSRAG